MEEFLPVLGFIIYIVLNLLGVVGKKKQKKPKPVVNKKPSSSPRKSIFEEIEQQLNPQPATQSLETTETNPQSAEILESPYSNLEEGILDETHLSKLHKPKPKIHRAKKRSYVFNNTTAKDAFIASIIFEKKHFDL